MSELKICNHAGYIIPTHMKAVEVLMQDLHGNKTKETVWFTLQARCVNPFIRCGQVFNFDLPKFKPLEEDQKES